MKPRKTLGTRWGEISLVARCLLVICATLVVVALIATAIRWAPQWLASTNGLKDPNQRVQEAGRVRTALLAVLAGSIAVVGAIYTARTFALNRRTYEHARETTRQSHELEQARLTTERFTRAIDQLGDEKLEVRLGGIYALERIARDSPPDRPAIAEVLSAYVRRRLPSSEVRDEHVPPLRFRVPDAQAALTVLCRSPLCDEQIASHSRRLNLSRTDLRRADLRGARLQRADLWAAQLQGADLRNAHLEGAILDKANFGRFQSNNFTFQRGADLTGANLMEAKLDDAENLGVALTEGTIGLPA